MNQSYPIHPRGARAKVLLTSVYGPYARDDDDGSRTINPMELYHNQVTRTQGAFSLQNQKNRPASEDSAAYQIDIHRVPRRNPVFQAAGLTPLNHGCAHSNNRERRSIWDHLAAVFGLFLGLFLVFLQGMTNAMPTTPPLDILVLLLHLLGLFGYAIITVNFHYSVKSKVKYKMEI